MAIMLPPTLHPTPPQTTIYETRTPLSSNAFVHNLIENMAHHHTIISYLFFISILLILPLEIRAKVPAVIVFGDSSVDAGNNNQISTILKSNFEPYGRDFVGHKATGRFSNGRVATDFISEAFGIKPAVPAYLDPAYSIKDFATGVCFASAGTGYDTTTSEVLSVIPLAKELDYFREYQKKLRSYLGEKAAYETLSESVYLMSLGTNDFLENYYIFSSRSSQFTIEEYQKYLAGIAENFVVALYSLGARKISVGGVPPMGCLPLERSTNLMSGSVCVEEYNRVAASFNSKLIRLVARLRGRLPDIKVVYSSVYDPFLQAIRNPSQYGFENVAVGCCATGMFEMGYLCGRYNPFTCTDANKYLFWDSFHPTEKMNRILADHVMNTSLAEFL